MLPIDGNLLRGHLESLLLAALERETGHGFDLIKRLDEDARGALALKEGTVYPILHRLEKAKLIKGEWDASAASKGPRRRVYRLTAKGHKDLAKRRAEWDRFVGIIGPLLEARS